jgi:DnaJ-class molecular chaperone
MTRTVYSVAEALARRECGACFGSGRTPRYRGLVREGPCIFCDGTGRKPERTTR